MRENALGAKLVLQLDVWVVGDQRRRPVAAIVLPAHGDGGQQLERLGVGLLQVDRRAHPVGKVVLHAAVLADGQGPAARVGLPGAIAAIDLMQQLEVRHGVAVGVVRVQPDAARGVGQVELGGGCSVPGGGLHVGLGPHVEGQAPLRGPQGGETAPEVRAEALSLRHVVHQYQPGGHQQVDEVRVLHGRLLQQRIIHDRGHFQRGVPEVHVGVHTGGVLGLRAGVPLVLQLEEEGVDQKFPRGVVRELHEQRLVAIRTGGGDICQVDVAHLVRVEQRLQRVLVHVAAHLRALAQPVGVQERMINGALVRGQLQALGREGPSQRGLAIRGPGDDLQEAEQQSEHRGYCKIYDEPSKQSSGPF
mmetsp:Transcript_18320/g.48355  ORF Transcript_18320/g.48355 Transcript_18320/m.48355 type:complete len:361 (+) Transcript_18320:1107-2189(+)